MSVYIIVHHRVKNYAEWKPVFDAHQVEVNNNGLKLVHLLRDQEDPNDLTIQFSVNDVEKAKSFLQSNDLQEAMKKSGVIGTPEILFLQDMN